MKYTAAVITVSDKCSRGERVDTSGPAVREILERAGFDVVYTGLVPDESGQIQEELIRCAGRCKRLKNDSLQCLKSEILVERLAIDRDVTLAGGHENSGNRRLSSAGSIIRNCFSHCLISFSDQNSSFSGFCATCLYSAPS